MVGIVAIGHERPITKAQADKHAFKRVIELRGNSQRQHRPNAANNRKTCSTPSLLN
ncbi:hypothetical protein OK016_20575 [Vibrio chagasii]|nr:hypothetical protein [Vibrio chagasii]